MLGQLSVSVSVTILSMLVAAYVSSHTMPMLMFQLLYIQYVEWQCLLCVLTIHYGGRFLQVLVYSPLPMSHLEQTTTTSM